MPKNIPLYCGVTLAVLAIAALADIIQGQQIRDPPFTLALKDEFYVSKLKLSMSI